MANGRNNGKTKEEEKQLGDKYNEEFLKGLDLLLDQAGRNGIRLILAFSNNWGEGDSKAQYVRWSPLVNDVARFWADPVSRRMYKDHMAFMTNRVNTVNGVRYKDDPTILAWNLMNEPRCDCDVMTEPLSYSCSRQCAEDMQAWIEEMALELKRLDPRHLVTVGEEGFYSYGSGDRLDVNPDARRWSGLAPGEVSEYTNLTGWPESYGKWAKKAGQNFTTNHQPRAIDFAALHLWPDNWGLGFALKFFTTFLQSHIDDAEWFLRKPVILQEFGKEVETVSAAEIAEIRDPIFTAAYLRTLQSYAADDALKGVLFWEWDRTFNAERISANAIQGRDSTWWRIIAPYSAELHRSQRSRPMVPDCIPLGNSSLESAVPLDPAVPHFYISQGQHLLALNEGADVAFGDGSADMQGVTAEECAIECEEVPECDSFSYHPAQFGGQCYLKNANAAESQVAWNEGGWQTFRRVPKELVCFQQNCAVCGMAGQCLRCQPGFLLDRADGRVPSCVPCDNFPEVIASKRTNCKLVAEGGVFPELDVAQAASG